MKFKEYVDILNKALKDNPEYGNLTTVYAIDEEGNAFYEIDIDNPVVGLFEDRDFTSYDTESDPDCPEYNPDLWDVSKTDINAICIN